VWACVGRGVRGERERVCVCVSVGNVCWERVARGKSVCVCVCVCVFWKCMLGEGCAGKERECVCVWFVCVLEICGGRGVRGERERECVCVC